MVRKWSTKVLLIIGVAAVSVVAQKVGEQWQAKRPNTQIFANEIRETFESAIATVGPNDVLTVTAVSRNHVKVRTPGGDEGFVAKGDVSKAARSGGGGGGGASKAFAFEAMEVQGYLDNPTPVYIIDMDDPNADPITLDRSFRDALKENVDKETMSRLSR